MAVGVVADVEVPLLDVVEFLGEVNLTGLLVVIEEAVDGRLDRVHGGSCGVGRGRGGHDEVDDVHRHGAIERMEWGLSRAWRW
jgi:hypothetical protein